MHSAATRAGHGGRLASGRRQFLELRERRTLMAVTVAFTVGLPVLFYGVRLVFHLADPAQLRAGRAPGSFATLAS